MDVPVQNTENIRRRAKRMARRRLFGGALGSAADSHYLLVGQDGQDTATEEGQAGIITLYFAFHGGANMYCRVVALLDTPWNQGSFETWRRLRGGSSAME